MLRLVDVERHCKERGLFYQPVGGNFVAEVRDARVFGVGCLNADGDTMVKGLSSGYYTANIAVQLERYIRDAELVLPDGGAIERGVLLWGDRNFGHWIFTYLNRLPLLFLVPQLLEEPLIVYDQTPPAFLDWLGLMGFGNIVLAGDGVKVGTLFVPSVVHYRDENVNVHICPNSVRVFRHLLCYKSGHERIYLSRANATRRRCINEDELVAHLEKRGIHRVFMEDLSAERQLDLISRCELVVTPIGASSPLTMLAPKTCRIVEIGLPGFSGVFGSRAWAQVIGQPYVRMDGEPAAEGNDSDYTVNLEKLDECLRGH